MYSKRRLSGENSTEFMAWSSLLWEATSSPCLSTTSFARLLVSQCLILPWITATKKKRSTSLGSTIFNSCHTLKIISHGSSNLKQRNWQSMLERQLLLSTKYIIGQINRLLGLLSIRFSLKTQLYTLTKSSVSVLKTNWFILMKLLTSLYYSTSILLSTTTSASKMLRISFWLTISTLVLTKQ